MNPHQPNPPLARPPQQPQPPHNQEQEPESSMVMDILQVVFFGTLAVFSMYVTFLIAATVLDQFLDGDLKLAGALILAIGIPLLTAAGDNSRREGTRIINSFYERVTRVFIGTAILCFATSVLVSLAMAGTVTGELRNNPNWFLTKSRAVLPKPTPFTEFNRKLSHVIADLVEAAARPLGLYDSNPIRAERPHDVTIYAELDAPRTPQR